MYCQKFGARLREALIAHSQESSKTLGKPRRAQRTVKAREIQRAQIDVRKARRWRGGFAVASQWLRCDEVME
jgi:hypothetical protein